MSVATTAPSEPWEGRKAAARALGIPTRKLGSLAALGAPMPEDGDEAVPVLPLLWWCWHHRTKCPLPEADEAERKLRIERLRLQNRKMSGAHLDAARRLLGQRLSRAREGLRQRLGQPTVQAQLRAAGQAADDHGAELARVIRGLVDQAIEAALR